MALFLLKTEPEVYSLSDLKRDGKTRWDHIRNFQARAIIKTIKAGDTCLIYHTGSEKQIVGEATVVKAPYPEPTSDKGEWICFDIAYESTFARAVTLAEIKLSYVLKDMRLVKQARLSVQPVEEAHYKAILQLAGKK